VTAVRIGPRTIVALAVASIFGFVAFAWPFLVSPGSSVGAGSVAPVIFGALLLLVLAVVLAQLSEGGLDSKALALLGVLSALGAAVRPLGAGTAGVETRRHAWARLIVTAVFDLPVVKSHTDPAN